MTENINRNIIKQSIVFDDIESQIGNLENSKNKENNQAQLIKMIFYICIVIKYVPFIICDLYYAYTTNTCVMIYPLRMTLNIQLYLYICAYVGIIHLFYAICCVYFISEKSENENKNKYIIYLSKLLIIVSGTFSLAWNIIGAVIFCGIIGEQDKCQSFLIYLFISLVIKLLINLNFIYQSLKLIYLLPKCIF